MFIDKLDDKELTHKILKVLRKLNEHLPDIVFDQFFSNIKFPEAIVKYLEQTPLEDIVGDAFLLFINVYDDNNTPQLISSAFIDKITTAMNYIEDENTLHSLVSILVCLMPYFQDKSTDPTDYNLNPIFKEFVTNEILYREKLIYITNRGNMYRLDKCCCTLKIIIDNPTLSGYYFNQNDLNLIVDILMREVTSNTNPAVRIEIYRLIESILNNKVYRNEKYKYSEVKEMV